MTIPTYEKAAEAARFINSRAAGHSPRLAIVLGSGLGGVAEAITDPVEIAYSDIPHFATSTVEGHAGRLVIGSCGGVDVAAMRGRFHFYEGYSMEEVTLPVRAFAQMGVRSLILTNAAGGASPDFEPGSLMIITDHINLMGENPLRGPTAARPGPRFPDMTHVYSASYIAAAREAAREMWLKLNEGVYIALRGPSYETPAEVRMLRALGGDAIGMSTAPEAIVARHSGMNVLGLSCITNVAAGLIDGEINHQEVMEVGARAGRQLSELIVRLIPRLVSLEAELAG
jgi:purine-nucleoside phosphorylase